MGTGGGWRREAHIYTEVKVVCETVSHPVLTMFTQRYIPVSPSASGLHLLMVLVEIVCLCIRGVYWGWTETRLWPDLPSGDVNVCPLCLCCQFPHSSPLSAYTDSSSCSSVKTTPVHFCSHKAIQVSDSVRKSLISWWPWGKNAGQRH